MYDFHEVIAMERKAELPNFIKTYLLSKFRLCLIVAIPSILIAGLLIFHMSITTLEDFKMQEPEVEAADSLTRANIGFHPSPAQSPAREINFHNTHRAPANYETYRFFMTLFTIALSVLFLIFLGCAISVWLNIKGSPHSLMYQNSKQYGGLQALLNQLDIVDQPHQGASLCGLIMTERLIVIPYFTYVYIAPISGLHWAYVALHITNSRSSVSTAYHLELHFYMGDERSKKIGSKEEGIRLLQDIKNKNPKVAIGYNRTCPNSQADIRNSFFGLFRNH